MKRFLLAVLIALLCGGALVAEGTESGLFLTPEVDLGLGIGNYLRGAAVGGSVMYDLGGLAAGVDARIDYDTAFNVLNVPLTIRLGFGRDFWFGAGYVLALGNPTLKNDDGSTVAWAYGGLPNIYSLGINLKLAELPFGRLVIPSVISYVVNTAQDPASDSLSQGINALAGILLGLKAYVGVALEFKAF